MEGDLWTSFHSAIAVEIATQLNPKLRPRYVALTQRRSVMAAPDDVEIGIESHMWIEIRDVKRRKLVTAIEFLSPTNKRDPGRMEYLEKRDKILHSTAHLVEIDLLRRGLRVPMCGVLPKENYFVFVGRADRRPITDVWRIGLKESLPAVPMPLLKGDPDVELNLQKAFCNVYDQNSFDLLIDYTEPPAIPLPRHLVAWAKTRIRVARAGS